MLGQFIFHTCNYAGLKMKAILRNSLRDQLDLYQSSIGEMDVSLRVFDQGRVVLDAKEFCKIKLGEYLEITEDNCPILADDQRDFLLVAQCSRGDGEQYFSQEHQVTYSIKDHLRETSLVYEQLPTNVIKPKTILLLAPKVWVSNEVNTIISFAISDDNHCAVRNESSWKIDFLDQDGLIIKTINRSFKKNDVYFLDAKAELTGYTQISDKLRMMSVVARGDSVGCVILTFIKNEKTGAIALEHSLSPHYYMDGDFGRVRAEAFLFD
jgi:hypothetical protein